MLGVGRCGGIEKTSFRVDFEQVLKEVVWRLVTEGRISYRRIKLSFAVQETSPT
jgi:hypothetical protein